MADLVEVSPILPIFGMTGIGEDIIGIPEPVGSYRVRGKLYYYVWVPGKSICKDTSVAHDGSSYSVECPFLKDDPGEARGRVHLSDRMMMERGRRNVNHTRKR